MQFHGTVFDASFGDSRGVGIERVERGNASPLALWQRLSPSRLLRGKLQDALQTRGVERRLFLLAESRNLAITSDKFQAKGQWILAGGSSKLINKTFHDESAAGVFDGAPPSAGHARFCESVLDAEIRCRIRNCSARAELAQPRIIRAFLAPLGGDGGRGLKMFPGREISIGVQRALQLVIGRRAIKIVLHVVFAGPQNNDRFARS